MPPHSVVPSQHSQDHAPIKSPGPVSILIADDEHLVASGIADILKELGHTVAGIARDGEQALAMARETKPQLALLDIRMPKLTGPEVAAVLQTELNIPSIIVSAYSDEENLEKIRGYGATCGVYGYILKPVEQDELRIAIGLALLRRTADNMSSSRINQLERNLANRRIVEQAKWVLVQKKQMTEQQAHEKLQKAARDRRKTLVEVAQEVIQSGEL